MSKFDRWILKPISYSLVFIPNVFWSRNYWSDLIIWLLIFERKKKFNCGGKLEFSSHLSHYNCTYFIRKPIRVKNKARQCKQLYPTPPLNRTCTYHVMEKTMLILKTLKCCLVYLTSPNMYSNTLYTCTIWPFMYTNIYAGQDNGRNLVILTFEAIMGWFF